MAAFAIPLIASGISALGGLFGNRKSTATQQQQQTQRATGNVTTSGTATDTTTPNLDPATTEYLNAIRVRYLQELGTDTDLSGYQASGISNINRAGQLRNQALQNVLAARGLSYSPMAAGALAGNEASRISDVVNFQNQIPLLRNQLMLQKLQDAGNFFSRIPIGQTSTRTTTGTESRDLTTTGDVTGATTQPGNMLGGLFGGLGSSLAYLYGAGAFDKKTPKPATTGYGPNYPGVSGG